mmetsp:Transcript_27891/g.75161  ORF Transcript_27891/g.75161 Transcript_27891/m.75161 type:complete len:259 (-) Transcript_27891:609-1385(-)
MHLTTERVGRGGLDQTLQLRPGEVLGACCQVGQVHVWREVAALGHAGRFDFENLGAPPFVWQVDFDLHLKAAWAQQGLVNHVLAVRHADQQDVVERVHAVNLGEELVDNRVVHARGVPAASALLADGVNLVEDEDVEVRLVPALRLLLLRVRKELADVLLGLSHELGEHLGSVDHLWLVAVEHLADLPCHERLARAGRAKEKHATHVRDAELLEHRRREDAGGEGAAEYVRELGVQAADAHLLKVEVGADDLVGALAP